MKRRLVASVVALTLLGSTCHTRHIDISDTIRACEAIRVLDPSDRHVITTIPGPEAIEQAASFMKAHAGSWSGEDVFDGMPPSYVQLEFVTGRGQLVIGVGVGDESLWLFPSKSVWRRLDRRDRNRLLAIVAVDPATVPGFR